jgi:predicted regulator of amino acid metabolism with ACT domain
MSPPLRTTFEETIRQTLDIVRKESPLSINAIAELGDIDSRSVSRAINFILEIQDEFAKTDVKILEGKWGKVVWTVDRIDKSKLPETIRTWYIQKRFFENIQDSTPSKEQIKNMFEEKKRTSIEEVVRRVFKVLEIEDDITIAELSRRTRVNRKTVVRALKLISMFQDDIAIGHLSKKELVVWRRRTPINELDETTIMYQLKIWHFPDEMKSELSEDRKRELLMYT